MSIQAHIEIGGLIYEALRDDEAFVPGVKAFREGVEQATLELASYYEESAKAVMQLTQALKAAERAYEARIAALVAQLERDRRAGAN